MKLIYFLAVLTLNLFFAGCDLLPAPKERYKESHLVFKPSEARTIDFSGQRLEVFNDNESYHRFLAAYPSLAVFAPELNEESETIIFFTAYVDPCKFIPKVEYFVKRKDLDSGLITNTIHISNSTDSNNGLTQCEDNPNTGYYANFLNVQKTFEMVSLHIDNSHYSM